MVLLVLHYNPDTAKKGIRILQLNLFFCDLRWKDCLVSVTNDLGFAVGYAYVKQHFNDEAMIMVCSF